MKMDKSIKARLPRKMRLELVKQARKETRRRGLRVTPSDIVRETLAERFKELEAA
jgi:hypothetical protein